MDIEKLPRHEKIDMIGHMRGLQANNGWLTITRMLQDEIETVIASIIDVEAERPPEADKILKWRRYYLDYLINLPQHVINTITSEEMPENAIMQSDPYPKDNIQTDF